VAAATGGFQSAFQHNNNNNNNKIHYCKRARTHAEFPIPHVIKHPTQNIKVPQSVLYDYSANYPVGLGGATSGKSESRECESPGVCGKKKLHEPK